MPSLNRVMLIGRLGRDPELKYTQSGQAVANLNLATDESYTDQQGQRVERTEWHRVSVWGRQAENVANYLHKGSLCYVEGSLQTRKWQAQDGTDRYSTDIKGRYVQFLDSKGGGARGAAAPYQQNQNQPSGPQAGPQAGQQQSPPQQQQQDEDFGPAFPSEASGMDDVPF